MKKKVFSYFTVMALVVSAISCKKDVSNVSDYSLTVKCPSGGYTVKLYSDRQSFNKLPDKPIATAMSDAAGNATFSGIPKLGYAFASNGCNNSYLDSSLYDGEKTKSLKFTSNSTIIVKNNTINSFEVFLSPLNISKTVLPMSSISFDWLPLSSYYLFMANNVVKSDYRDVNFTLACSGQTVLIN